MPGLTLQDFCLTQDQPGPPQSSGRGREDWLSPPPPHPSQRKGRLEEGVGDQPGGERQGQRSWGQILSGIHKFYEPEQLVGKTLVAIVNLPPRKMMGHESNGMLLSCVHKEKGEEKLNLIMLDDKIPAGAKLS